MTTRRRFNLWLASAALSAPFSGVAAQAATPVPRKTAAAKTVLVRSLNLDGVWQAGLNRRYDRALKVPGLATDPAKVTDGTLWYRREVAIPKGNWTSATLTLKGARFAPEVHVDGVKVSQIEGGMAATRHRFALPKGAAGKPLSLEIALQSLRNLDPKDASFVPAVDQWRSNVSSHLWDSVELRLHGNAEILRVLPQSDLKADTLKLKWELLGSTDEQTRLCFLLIDANGVLLHDSGPLPVEGLAGQATLNLEGRIQPWWPEAPALYRLRTELRRGDVLVDAFEQHYGHRECRVDGYDIQLNHETYPVRMGTVVWQRWLRDPEAKDIAFDTRWFENNVVLRLKALGANGLRFHLGLPPEVLLDLCDRHGLVVQMEWSFFHGIGGSAESMDRQWRDWLDTAARHPSVIIVQGWNETAGQELQRARSVILPLLDARPPLIMNGRELTPVHKYWWSLFENLGLYYDRREQLPGAVMVDEFGGNYLDGDANPGAYPTTRETFLRFLGRDSTVEDRLQLHTDSNARVAEYWRRLRVAGFSPFAIVGSREDGSHWFMGRTDVANPKPKPVWQALSAAFAEVSLSLEIWNRNFAPSERVKLPLHWFNDSSTPQTLQARIQVSDKFSGKAANAAVSVSAQVAARSAQQQEIEIVMPATVGEWRIEAHLLAPQPKTPVVSQWDIRTYVPQAEALKAQVIGLLPEEVELKAMFEHLQIKTAAITDKKATVIVGGAATWKALQDAKTRAAIDTRRRQSIPVVLTEVGPQPLGVGYNAHDAKGPLEAAPVMKNPKVTEERPLFGGVKVGFKETAEPESAVQAPAENRELWAGLPKQATWLWNGLRGGLIVPAVDMLVSGLNGDALLTAWSARGADPAAIKSGSYFAYELAGYYAYGSKAGDKAVSDALRQRVKFLVEDAPALEMTVNPNAPITETHLHQLYTEGQGAEAQSVEPLVNAGKNLSRSPVVRLSFGQGSGVVILSQLLTNKRLSPEFGEDGPGFYGRRYDPVAVQFVLNMIVNATR